MKRLLVVALALAVAGVASADRGPGNSRGGGQVHQGNAQHQAQTRGGVQAHQGVGVQQHQAQGRSVRENRGVQGQDRAVHDNRGVQGPGRTVHDYSGGGQAHQGREVTHDNRTNRDVRDHRGDIRIHSHTSGVVYTHTNVVIVDHVYQHGIIFSHPYYGIGYIDPFGYWVAAGVGAIIGAIIANNEPVCHNVWEQKYRNGYPVIFPDGRPVMHLVLRCPTVVAQY